MCYASGLISTIFTKLSFGRLVIQHMFNPVHIYITSHVVHRENNILESSRSS